MHKLLDLKRILRIEPDFLISYVSRNPIVDDMDLPNDDDGKLGIKYSFKGPLGLGNENAGIEKRFGNKKQKSKQGYLPVNLRYIHLTHIGKIDPYSSPKSDPGLGGLICPTTELYEDKYLYPYQEPNKWRESYHKLLNELEFLKRSDQVKLIKDKLLNVGPTKIVEVEDKKFQLKERFDEYIELPFRDDIEIPPKSNICGNIVDLDTSEINNDFWI